MNAEKLIQTATAFIDSIERTQEASEYYKSVRDSSDKEADVSKALTYYMLQQSVHDDQRKKVKELIKEMENAL